MAALPRVLAPARMARLKLGHLGAATLASPTTRRHFSAGPQGGLRGKVVDFAFAFDIDGVLMHANTPLLGAPEALQCLHDHRIPFMLLTNGGGRLERDRVSMLSEKLGVPISQANFVQSHTPFMDLVDNTWDSGFPEGLADKTVFVTGSHGGQCRGIMHSYGFTKVVTPADILHANPLIFPFDPLLEHVYANTAQPLPRNLWRPEASFRKGLPLRIDAIFVLNDPRDWALDIQLITDILASDGGCIGRPPDPDFPSLDPTPKIYYSNSDLTWATSHHTPRLGQGAFHVALEGVWRSLDGPNSKPDIVKIGKPYARTYSYAEKVLEKHRTHILRKGRDNKDNPIPPLRRVYMVGDNPASDIRGANEYKSAQGTEWWSILVRTGVFKRDRPEYRPRVITTHVWSAVEHALEREGYIPSEMMEMPADWTIHGRYG